MNHFIKVKIYYEDTDCGGVVYYANYLRYLERARTDFLESKGISLRELMDDGIYFIVAEASLSYISPGVYGDNLLVGSEIEKTGPVSIVFRHVVSRENTEEQLVKAIVKLACVGRNLKPLRLKPEIIKAINS
ncbi:MAG: YbgC/FadM family acyl-CoA thioesterase [Nitrospiraceae bacterium]|nr:MAG: YbgC/FadM family acyl-CoA thioesterase [Nitrospiraceae bacterium]